MNIVQALTLAAKVATRATPPILECVLVDSGGLTVTSAEMHITIRVPVPGWTGAARPLHAKTLLAAVKAAGPNLAAIGPHAVTLTAGATIAVETLEAADFPSFNAGNLPIEFTMPAATLALMLGRTAPAESTEVTRFYLQGTYLHAGAGVLVAVATDGRRLVKAEAALPEGAAGIPGVIIPRGTTKLLRDVLGKKPEGDARIRMSDTRIQVTIGPVTLTSKLVNGTFPEYHRVIPHDPTPRLSAQAAELRTAIKAVTVGQRTETAVGITGAEVWCGTNRYRLTTAHTPGGEDHETRFNGRYLLDVLAPMGTHVTLAQTDPRGPAVFADPADPSWLGVLMPVRL